jgi:[protein-PII] uridylyltransferase
MSTSSRPATIRRLDAYSEDHVLELAVHLGNAERADALFFLAGALAAGDATDRERLDALYELLAAVFGRDELVSRGASNEVELRRAGARRLLSRPEHVERVDAAPRHYVLMQSSEDLARHARLCEPPPRGNDVRLRVDAVDHDFLVEVVTRDRIGLLAHTTGVLLAAGCSVLQATVVTWGDGTGLASYRVSAGRPPDALRLRSDLIAALRGPLSCPPWPDVALEFDDQGSPWYTRCTATAPDVPGVLRALTTAFAASGASVHSARVATEADRVVDVFELTDARGAKIDNRTKEAIRVALERGIVPPGRLLGLVARGRRLLRGPASGVAL